MQARLSFAVVCLPLAMGCGNPFATFYSGDTLLELRAAGVSLAEPEAVVVVEETMNLERSVLERYEDGWVMLGSAAWTGPDPGSKQNAIAQAQQVGASLVLHSWTLLGQSTTSVPITLPTTTTSYASGTAYGSYGSAAWSGTQTTYGSQTTYMPVTTSRYSASAAFFAKRSGPPILGLLYRRLSPEEQAAAGTVEGLLIFCVIRGSPAALAGVLPGDVFLSVDGVAISSPEHLSNVALQRRGSTISVVLRRRGEVLSLRINLGE